MSEVLTLAEVRSELLEVTSAAKVDVRALLANSEALTAENVRDLLIEYLPEIVEQYELSAGSLAADWYDDYRAMKGVGGRFEAIVAEPAGAPRWSSLSRWGTGPLFKPEPDHAAMRTLVEGGVHKTVANAHRNTIMSSSIADPKSHGWARYGRGDTCSFCRALIGRGEVYSESTARFGAHDNCSCVAGPSFDESNRVGDYVLSARRKFGEPLNPADAARAREWAAQYM